MTPRRARRQRVLDVLDGRLEVGRAAWCGLWVLDQRPLVLQLSATRAGSRPVCDSALLRGEFGPLTGRVEDRGVDDPGVERRSAAGREIDRATTDLRFIRAGVLAKGEQLGVACCARGCRAAVDARADRELNRHAPLRRGIGAWIAWVLEMEVDTQAGRVCG